AADIRLIDSQGLMVDESAMTGESVPIIKDHEAVIEEKTQVFELKNTLLAGTIVVRGSGHGIVVHTGHQTYLASLAKKAEENSPPTPLEKAIGFFSKRYVALIIALCSLMGTIGYFQGRSMIDLAYILLASIVSAVPEGLPIVMTLVMAIGALKLSKKNAIVRSLPAVETLGSVTVIASDKTGTITKGELQVAEVYTKNAIDLEHVAALCNDAQGKTGDPLDVALAYWVSEFDEIRTRCPRKWAYAFDTRLMLMATVNEVDGEATLFVKGAFEALKRQAEEGSSLDEIERVYLAFLEKGYRVLAFGIGKWRGEESPSSWKIELVGLIGFIDPPKEGLEAAVNAARSAKIKILMITGDHPKTAVSVAEKIGIASKEDGSLTGQEIEALTDDELFQKLEKKTVLARILPEHKYRVVKVFQKGGELVAMTGDGVNDVPALKAADMGIAMGSGTEAAKGASDMIITDNNLQVIVNAIHNARVIADNIRKVIYYLIATSLMELSFIALVIFTDYPLPISAIQILWINIVTDGVQDKVFAFTKEEGDVMHRGPRPPNRQFFDFKQVSHMLHFGFGMAIYMFFLYLYLLKQEFPFETLSAILFSSIVISQWADGIQAQKENEPFFKNIKKSITINPFVFYAIAVGALLQCIPIYVFPKVFNAAPLTFSELKYPLITFFVAFFWLEARKWIDQKFSKDCVRR
ncbi:MAG: cation-transporting P-type ATPase, partial [Chlamydiae bacterium]|nr:cation-transporting P-type ATPase [Chlamydiota bacterium]